MAEIFKPLDIKVYLAWIEQIVKEKIELNDWESEFVSSLYKRLSLNSNLTYAQANKLEDIYARTS